MPRYTYFFENIMFRKKWHAALFGSGKGKDQFELIKSLVYSRVKRSALVVC